MGIAVQDAAPPAAIRVGVSACLLGCKVRFDGNHKHNRFITDALAEYFDFVSFCPEVAIGMGTPREPIRLVGAGSGLQAVGVKDAQLNVTRPLRAYAGMVAQRIDDLSGFIFKKDSPSCGMERVKVYQPNGVTVRSGTGIFAQQIIAADPLLPVEEEGRLNDPGLCDSFVTRVYVYARWKALRDAGITKSALLDFHASHKLLVLSHSTEMYRQLGRLLSGLDRISLDEVADTYIARLMQALGTPATRKRHANVLQHLLGYLKNNLDASHRTDLMHTIEAYRLGEYPLVVPIRLLQHHFSSYPHPYINRQVYLDPHPQGLKLRNAL